MMNPRRYAALLAALLLVLAGGVRAAWAQGEDAVAVLEAAATDNAPQHPLWKVTSAEGGTAYLLGSVHLLNEEAHPLSDTLERAFDVADVLAFELDLDQAAADAPQMMQRGMFSDNRTLKDVLSPETYALAEHTLDSLGLPIARFQKMEPWLLALTLSALEMQKAGYTGEQGVDAHFFNKAKEDGKKRVGLETMADQLDLFDSLNAEKQEAFLRYTLRDLKNMTSQIDTLTAAWKSGDTQTLDAILNEGFAPFPVLRERLLVNRNRAWVPQIERIMSEEGTPLVVVGAGHLVGEDSVVEMLRERGYTVEQL